MNRIAALLLSLCVGAAAHGAALKAGVFEPARQAPDFALRGSDGTELKLSRYKGKVVLLGFGFTNCADVCPVTLAVLATARKSLGEAAKDVQVVYVTVDPERDDAARMRKYLAGFDASFVGGTGTPAQLEAVRKSYGVQATRLATAGIDHSSSVYIIDQAGKLRAMMPYGRGPGDYVHDVKMLLAK
jgi:protein SCO1